MPTTLRSLALAVAVIAAALLLLAGPGARLGLWPFGTGFLLLRIALFTGLVAATLALILLLIPKTRAAGVLPLAVALAMGLGIAWVPWSGLQKVRSLPYIHDISTDTRNPPAFVAILPLRADAPNPPEYAGAEVAAQQRAAYPDIGTLTLAIPASRAFEQALGAARAMGWEIVAADPGAGRIEATDTTFWFGFKDDVVIRIEEAGNGSRLDMRSKSRVGRSDVGANAARIRRFFAALEG